MSGKFYRNFGKGVGLEVQSTVANGGKVIPGR